MQHQNQNTDLSQPQNHNLLQGQPKAQDKETAKGITRRNLFYGSMVVAAQLGLPKAAIASPNGVVTVLLESPRDSLGVEIYDTMLRGTNVVAIRKIVAPTKSNRFLYEGMILVPRNGGSYYSKEFVEKLKSGPYPLEVDFLNLAAAGDAISDMGSSIVTPRDALELAQRTEDSSSISSGSSNNLEQKGGGYGITTLQQTSQSCAIQSRRNDVLEIEYEASYITEDGRKVVYDASAFRGTGRPYQVVLGSGDMIPGVDQGIYNMCPGDKRLLTIPPVLGHGPKSRKLYMIPDSYKNLEWEISLVTIDSTITADNNNVSRDDREGRFAY
jgi:FK506-binding protein 2